MKSSGNSSAKANPSPAGQPPRKAFALTGRSASLDPRTHAVRGDLADVRLAEQVFAPHYAAPLRARALRAIALYADRNLSEHVADLTEGDVFEVLELAGHHAWGSARKLGLVGYVDRTALDKVTDFDS